MRSARASTPPIPLLAAVFVTAGPTAVWAQAPASGSVAQPSAPTPPTPLPERPPATETAGIRPQDIRPNPGFRTVVPGQPQPGDPTAIRTLADALAIAFQRSPSVLLATERAYRTTRVVGQLTAARGPQINGSLSYVRLADQNSSGATGGPGITPGQIQNPFPVGIQITPPGTIPISLSGGQGTGAGQGTGSAGAISTGGTSGATGTSAATRAAPTRQQGQDGGFSLDLNRINARVSVSQLIDITGIVRTAIQVGRLEEAFTRLELARTRQELALNVRNGYYNVLRTQALVRVNEAAVAQSEELVRVTELQLQNGVASQFDVLRARTQLQVNRQALINSRNQVGIAKNAFANQLGIDPSTPVDPETPADPAIPVLDEEPLITTALGQRPEYLQADTNILRARGNVRLARRTLEPSLSANLTGTFDASPGVASGQRDAATVGLFVTLPIWDAGSTREAVAAARSDERGALIQKDQFVRGIKAEVQQAIIAVRDARERVEVASASIVEAREALRLANVRLREGIGTRLEVTDAQSVLTIAETNEVNARYDLLSALARLSRAIGTPE